MGMASPSYSLSTPAMILSRVDLPEPFRPSTPILAPGKKDSEMSFRISRFGGTTLPTRFIVYTYCAMPASARWVERRGARNYPRHEALANAAGFLTPAKLGQVAHILGAPPIPQQWRTR